MHMRQSPKPGPALVPGSASTTEVDPERATAGAAF